MLIIFSVLYFGCKKSQDNSSQLNFPSEQKQLISDAKNYFEQNVKGTANQGKSLNDIGSISPGNFSPIASLIKNALWD